MPGEFFLIWNFRLRVFFLGGGPVARLQKLFGFGKIAGLRIGAYSAEGALDGATVGAVGGRKRGVLSANWLWAS